MKNTQTDRRDFIKSVALLTASAPFYYFHPKSARQTDILTASMSFQEHLVPASVIWDSANLVMKYEGLSWKMMDSISEEFNKLISGFVLQHREKFVPEIIDITKASGGWSSQTHPKVALLAGYLAYHAMYPVLTAIYPNDRNAMAPVHRDARILTYRAGQGEVHASTQEIQDLLNLMYHRAAFRMHTLTPDKKDWEAWVIRYLDWYQQDRERIGELAHAINPPTKVDSIFFNPNDRLIKQANDYSIRRLSLNDSFFENAGVSVYTQAVSRATSALKMLDDFYQDKISKRELLLQLNLEK